MSSIAQPLPKPPVIRSSSPKYYPEIGDLRYRFITLVKKVIGLGSQVEDLKIICIELLNDVASAQRNVQEDIIELKKCSDSDCIVHLQPYWDPLDCDLLYQLIRELQKPELMADWERYKVEVKEACKQLWLMLEEVFLNRESCQSIKSQLVFRLTNLHMMSQSRRY